MNDTFQFERVCVKTEPFLHFSAKSFMAESAAEALLSWFESGAIWIPKHEVGFYESFDISLRASVLPVELKFLVDDSFLENVRSRVSALMNARLGQRTDVTAHKLIPGYHIGIHNDFGPIRQSHRLLVQLNRGWKAENGGILMLFEKQNPDELCERERFYLPLHRSATCFEISPHSFHAVSTVNSGNRYTLCISFYGPES